MVIEIFHSIKKKKKFFQAIYFFISSLCSREKGKRKQELDANLNSMICHIYMRLLRAVVHLRHLTHLYTTPHNNMCSHHTAFNHDRIRECWCSPPDFTGANEHTFLHVCFLLSYYHLSTVTYLRRIFKFKVCSKLQLYVTQYLCIHDQNQNIA